MLCPKCGHSAPGEADACPRCGHALGGQAGSGSSQRAGTQVPEPPASAGSVPRRRVGLDGLRLFFYPAVALLVFLFLTNMLSAYQDAEGDRADASLRHQLLQRKKMLAEAARLLKEK